MKALRILIVDDEPLAIRRLQIALKRLAHPPVVAVASDGPTALAAVGSFAPDVLLLDIKMPGLDGFEVAERLAGPDPPAIIFVTAFDRFAVRAFGAGAIDYLLKPVEFERLADALGKVQERQEARNTVAELEELKTVLQQVRRQHPTGDGPRYETEVWIHERQGSVRVPVSRIEWITAERDYARLHAGDRVHLLRATMQRLEQQLDPTAFTRIHRSVIVQSARVQSISKSSTGSLSVLMMSGAELPIGRRYAAAITRRLTGARTHR